MFSIRKGSPFSPIGRGTGDLTQGNAVRVIAAFALPIMVGNLFQQMYSMVDTAVVGKGVGAAALAAVGAASPVTQLLLGLIIGMTGGMSVVIAQQFGAGNERRTRTAIVNGMYLLIALTALVTVLGLLCCRALFHLIHTPEEMMEGASVYAMILFAGAAAAAAYNYEAGVLRAFGNSVIPLLLLIVTSLLNVGLDLLFVMVWRGGIAGAAIATVLSQLVSGVLCFLYMKYKIPLLHFGANDWRPDPAMLLEHLRTGIPMAFFSSLLAVSFLLLQSALNSLGGVEMAAYTAASKMDTLVYQILGAFGTAVSTFAAQNYGKGELQRVRTGVRKCLVLTMGISVMMTGFVFVFGNRFMQLFIGENEAQILTLGLQYMRVTSAFYWILGLNFVIRFALIGVGKTVIPLAVGISEILTRAAVAFVLVDKTGFAGMTLASPACWFTSTLLCACCYRPMMNSVLRKSHPLSKP